MRCTKTLSLYTRLYSMLVLDENSHGFILHVDFLVSVCFLDFLAPLKSLSFTQKQHAFFFDVQIGECGKKMHFHKLHYAN